MHPKLFSRINWKIQSIKQWDRYIHSRIPMSFYTLVQSLPRDFYHSACDDLSCFRRLNCTATKKCPRKDKDKLCLTIVEQINVQENPGSTWMGFQERSLRKYEALNKNANKLKMKWIHSVFLNLGWCGKPPGFSAHTILACHNYCEFKVNPDIFEIGVQIHLFLLLYSSSFE